MSKLCRKGLLMIMIMILPQLNFAYAGNAAYMRCIFRQISHILPQEVPHILRKFSIINQHPYLLSLIHI